MLTEKKLALLLALACAAASCNVRKTDSADAGYSVYISATEDAAWLADPNELWSVEIHECPRGRIDAGSGVYFRRCYDKATVHYLDGGTCTCPVNGGSDAD